MELAQCRARLAEHASPANIQSLFYRDTLAHLKSEIQQRVEMVLLAYGRDDPLATESAVQGLLSSYGVQSEERRRAVENISKSLIDCMLPVPYMYLMWAAQHDSGVFNPEKLPNEDGLKQQDEATYEWNDILASVKLTEGEHIMLYKSKETLKNALVTVTTKVRRFVEAKKDLASEVKRLDDFVNEQMLSKVSGYTVGGFLHWLQRVRSPSFTGRFGASQNSLNCRCLASLGTTSAASTSFPSPKLLKVSPG